MSDIASRVAARFLKAQGDEEGAEAALSAAAPVAALPKSGPGMDMFKGLLDKLVSAYEGGDGDGFGKALEGLSRSHEKLNR